MLKGVLEAKATRSCSKTPVRTGELFLSLSSDPGGPVLGNGLGIFPPTVIRLRFQKEISALLKNTLLGSESLQ